VTFLPIIERELRVAARKRSTFWLRIVAALVAILLGAGCLVLTMAGNPGSSAANLGREWFSSLTWLSLAASLSAGLFFTSDCLSEEKREGTIGFLFLTDLSSFDVVLGKLLATSLRGFYALLAVMPILAVTLLMGGVTGAQFWKTALSLVNALLFSLAAGLFVSAISRDSQKALAATLLLLVMLIGGGPVSDTICAALRQRPFRPVLSLSSPGFLFVTADAWGKSPFWAALLVNQAVAWLLLGLTCRLLPRTWREKSARTATVLDSWTHWWKFGGPKRRAALRRKLIGSNPVVWLACRERWQAFSLWAVSLLMAGGAAAIFASKNQSTRWLVWSYFGGASSLVVYLGMASQASRFFLGAQRSGLLELLLATPLTEHTIVQGQWRALRRMFALPLALYLAAQLTGTFMVQQNTWSRMAATAPATPTSTTTTANTTTVTITNTRIVTRTTVTGTVQVSAPGLKAPHFPLMAGMAMASTLTAAANLAALIWFGMWMGMNSKNPNTATLKTILFVQVIPWLVIAFASGLAIPLLLLPGILNANPTAPSQMMVWYPVISSIVVTVLSLAKDVAFVIWARKKLYSKFRERAAEALAPVRSALPPPLPPTGAPPVIAPT